jgi:hypothetical protein
MIAECDIGGVFVPTYVIWAVLALALKQPVQWALTRLGAYRFVWHRGLFDIALLLLLWAGIAATSSGLHLAE